MKIGILGYGNLGRGVEAAVKQNQIVNLLLYSHAAIHQL